MFHSEPLKQRQHDPDENVRMDVVQAIVGAARKDFNCITDDLLTCVKERTLDKKVQPYVMSAIQTSLRNMMSPILCDISHSNGPLMCDITHSNIPLICDIRHTSDMCYQLF